MTKKQKAIFEAYTKSNLKYLYDCYERPSEEKRKIIENCRKRCLHKKGVNFYIISYNKFMFTIGFVFKDTENRWWFHYESNKTIKEWLID